MTTDESPAVRAANKFLAGYLRTTAEMAREIHASSLSPEDKQLAYTGLVVTRLLTVLPDPPKGDADKAEK